MMRPPTEQSYQQCILLVLVHIQEHLDEELSLTDLARVANFSPYHFHRIFRGMVGESVKEHVRRLRLERAAHRLKFTDQAIVEMALDAGYETHEAFTRAFHAAFGQPPSRFREIHQSLVFPHVRSGVHYAPDARIEKINLTQGGTAMEVRVEAVPEMRVAFIRHVGPYDKVGGAWMRLMMWAGMRGLLRGKPTMIGVVHDDPEVTPEDKIRYDACLLLQKDVKPEGEIGVQSIGDGPYAVTTHHGPYERLGDTYARLCGEWLSRSGRQVRSAPCLEAYLNSPRDTKPENLLTEIYMPLEIGT